MPDWSKADHRFMRRALELAQAQHGKTGPNPAVGCVLVKDGKIIGEAATAIGGRPHGETQALDLAGQRAKGSTAYVTLEPCSHIGQTGPCARALIDAKISRCVIACIDPDPRVHWRGAAMLQEAGIDTSIGLLAAESQNLNADFFEKFP